MADSNEVPDLPGMVVAEQTQLRLPSFPHWIEAAVEYLRHKAVLSGACQESRSAKLMMALHEALSNAIVHGNLEVSSDLKERGDNTFAEALAQRVADPRYSDREVEILIDCNLDRCRWTVTDQGQGFDVDDVLRKKLSDDPEELLSSGRGILIMRSFLDDVTYERGGRRLLLTLRRASGQEKRLHPRVPVQQTVQVVPVLGDGTVDWDSAYEAVSRNFSERGVSLLQQKMTDAARLLVGITIGNQLVYVPAAVRHCRSLGEVVEVGCTFEHRVVEAPDKLEDLSEETRAVHQAVNEVLAAHGSPALLPDNRRLHQRVVYNERIQVLSKGAAKAVDGYARDLSRGGIAFIATVALPLEVTILFLPQDGGSPLCLRSQVVRCTKIMDHFYDVGARFLQLAPKETPE